MNFRTWCREKWYEHIDEMVMYTGQQPTYLANEYFNKYKYWLKREFKYQRKSA